MINGSCHCGNVQWQFDVVPKDATACNCTVCRRYGTLWAYDFEGEQIHVSGPTQVYIRGQAIEFHFCPNCGCVAYWRSRILEDGNRRRIAVNLRLTEQPETVAHILIDHFDGFDSFEDLPRDGRCVGDYWF
ncbi:MAG: GFA family protein [Chloroflexota bacterium]